jgi:hypothetical protein
VAQSALRINMRVDGARETLAAFRRLPKEATKELRQRSVALAESLAGKVKAAATADRSPQAALFAPTVRARRDRLPTIVAGGSSRVGRNKMPAWGILFGGEFGANRYPQFGKPHSGTAGTGPIFGVVQREQGEISRRWNEAADAIVAAFTAGDRGGG